MSHTLWIVLAFSVLAVVGFVAVIYTQLRTNREIDSKIDYSKVKPWVDDEDEDEEKKLKERWGR